MKLINNVSGLQLYQLMRPVTFVIISIIFTKTLPIEDVARFEMFMFIASALTFFWVTGINQSLLTIYNRNKTYRETGNNVKIKSPEIFNAFVLLCLFSVILFIFGQILKRNFSVFHISGDAPYLNLLLLYVLLSSPVCIIEFIYLLNNRSHRIVQYGLYTYVPQLLLVIIPVVISKSFIWSIYGLLFMTLVRWVWLIVLLRRYSEFKLSVDFIKEHLYLGAPLILTTLISGSAQYIDSGIISAYYKKEAVFAVFRYGAKEFQLVVMLSTGLSTAMLAGFSTREKMKESLILIREKSARLMHLLFPASMIAMLLARWAYPVLFSPEYSRGADIFVVYLLLVIPRLVFPQTIVIGRQRTNITLITAAVAQIINIPLSIALIPRYNVIGVALSTVVVYVLEKIFLVIYVKFKMRINPAEYIPVKLYMMYSLLISILFVLIDHRVIDIK